MKSTVNYASGRVKRDINKKKARKQERGIHGIIRTRNEPHATPTGLYETPSVANLLANDGNFIARFHIQFPEFSFACECEQHSGLVSVDVLLEMIMLLACVII